MRPAVAVGATAIALATACTRVVDDARVVAAPDMGKAGATASDCTSVDTPMTSIADHSDEEPIMKIPQPDGWERVTLMDSELIRFTMRNEGLVRDDFAPTAWVMLESHPGLAEPREGVRRSSRTRSEFLGIGATDVQADATTLCQLPAETIDYITPQLGPLPPHPARVVTAVLHTEKDARAATTLTVQSADADDPTYQRDAETILTGFQMLPPSDA